MYMQQWQTVYPKVAMYRQLPGIQYIFCLKLSARLNLWSYELFDSTVPNPAIRVSFDIRTVKPNHPLTGQFESRRVLAQHEDGELPPGWRDKITLDVVALVHVCGWHTTAFKKLTRRLEMYFYQSMGSWTFGSLEGNSLKGLMAFLATEDRFGPDLDRYRRGEPNPCTYTPEDDRVLLPGGENAIGTFGYHRLVQHEKPSHFVVAASSSPAIAATLKALEENSLQRMRDTSEPTPCTYAPTVEGQFPRVYTMKEILAERKLNAIQRKLVKNEDAMTAQELHLALGPGSYDVSQDTNQEMIATPFTFTHEKRHGILDNAAALGRVGCSPGPALYRVESSTAVPSASTVASAPFRSKHASAFVTRVRSDSLLHQQQKKDAALYSKELAKSYQELGASVQRLGHRLASPELREQTFRRFDKDESAVEAYRRGPGSYGSPCQCTSSHRRKSTSDGDIVKNDEGACTRPDCFQLSPLPSIRLKPSTSFGLVASRDLLTSMIAAGHASAHTIGPGVYDAHPSSFIVPTHNLGYKQELKRVEPKSRPQGAGRSQARSADSDDTRRLSRKEMWNAMKQGPMLSS